MIRFQFGPYSGQFGFDGRLTINQPGLAARRVEQAIQATVDGLRANTPGYFPSADRFFVEALQGFDVTILERIDPDAPPIGAES